MTTSEIFNKLLASLKVGDTAKIITSRHDEITKALSKNFQLKDGCTNYGLMAEPFGRRTTIKDVSDFDMIYILLPDIRASYSDEDGPRRILERVRDVLKDHYLNTETAVDQCIVRVQFVKNIFKFEVQPTFEGEDGNPEYPDTSTKCWEITKPRDEISATKEYNGRTSKSMRYLARMARAWKNASGMNMDGLLIDTLVYRFFEQNYGYDSAGTSSFRLMIRDSFDFLKNEPNREYYLTLGSNQRVKVKSRFQSEAKKAYNRCIGTIASEDDYLAARKWRKVFGISVPLAAKAKDSSFNDTEEFIRGLHSVDITDTLNIDCEVTQDDWRPTKLREMLHIKAPLKAGKKLKFWATGCSVVEPYTLKWKVLSQSPEARRQSMIREGVIDSVKPEARIEHSNFRGDHIIECYVIKGEVIIVRDRIDAPITTNGS